jgi:hypothetical protein
MDFLNIPGDKFKKPTDQDKPTEQLKELYGRDHYVRLAEIKKLDKLFNLPSAIK